MFWESDFVIELEEILDEVKDTGFKGLLNLCMDCCFASNHVHKAKALYEELDYSFEL